MEFVHLLNKAFLHHNDNDNDNDNESYLTAIAEWNNKVEAYLAAPPSSSSSSSSSFNDKNNNDEKENNETDMKQIIETVASTLQQSLVHCATGNGGDRRADAITSTTTSDIQNVIKKLRQEDNNDNETISSYLKNVSCWIQTNKNIMRWYIQIYLEQTGPIAPSLLKPIQLDEMLELYVTILQKCCDKLTKYHDLARNTSLLLFYATYIRFPSDMGAQQSLSYLVNNLEFPKQVLQHLLQPHCSVPLALSLVRHVHNILVSLQGGLRLVIGTKLDWGPTTTSSSLPPWAPTTPCTVSFYMIFIAMAKSILNEDPPFQTLTIDNNDDQQQLQKDQDKRTELIQEIIGSLYAFGASRNLSKTSHEDIINMLLKLLNLSNNDSQQYRCKLSCISLLMDADASSFGELLVERNAVEPLLHVLDKQVSDIVDSIRVDNSAAADLLPILIVLQRFATANDAFKSSAKQYIFPVEQEEYFQQKVVEQQSKPEGSKKNMSPLDAPKGTLRWKLTTRLMTWTESHIKRCTSELLWTLCNEDATEFVYRTGLGNAIPMLNLKGLVQMPPEAMS